MYTYVHCNSGIKVKGKGVTLEKAKQDAYTQMFCKHLDRKQTSCFVYKNDTLFFVNLKARYRFQDGKYPELSSAFKYRYLQIVVFELLS